MNNEPVELTTPQISWLAEANLSLPIREALGLPITCPHCQSTDRAADLHFGHLYEFTCPTCKNLFVVEIPDITVRKGRIEKPKD
jgi:transposase-like protein